MKKVLVKSLQLCLVFILIFSIGLQAQKRKEKTKPEEKHALDSLKIHSEKTTTLGSPFKISLQISGDELVLEYADLQALYDLVNGTIFHINFNSNIDRMLNV